MCLVLCVGSASAATARILKLNAHSNLRDPNDVSHVLTYLKKGTKVLWTGKSTHKTMYLVTPTVSYQERRKNRPKCCGQGTLAEAIWSAYFE